MLKKIFIISGLALLTACSNSGSVNASLNVKNNKETQLINGFKTNTPSQSSVAFEKQLAQVYQEWVGTRYRLGGESKNGIDCSAFTQIALADAFGISLPRSTFEQRHVGKQIQKANLKPGDLVFFRANRHVGIYIGNNEFMHAGTRSGVTISSLTDSYWSRTYTQSRRVI
ncbi:MAG: NlpC/P60 family protein [[Pasteurella] mairii]|uniref:NLP/P60 family protein n=1 Tax=[Pasteurella] mairii TaxID=757 RepID=A0A379B4B8_9PAST|nr:NlpC/P60 family protein [[Pasteurella] mairii]SUB33475.1 NLP/P60 family protein [[Pasteurella] mairii]